MYPMLPEDSPICAMYMKAMISFYNCNCMSIHYWCYRTTVRHTMHIWCMWMTVARMSSSRIVYETWKVAISLHKCCTVSTHYGTKNIVNIVFDQVLLCLNRHNSKRIKLIPTKWSSAHFASPHWTIYSKTENNYFLYISRIYYNIIITRYQLVAGSHRRGCGGRLEMGGHRHSVYIRG